MHDHGDWELDEEPPGGWPSPVRTRVVVVAAMLVGIAVTTLLHIATRGGNQLAPCTVPTVVGLPEADARLAAEAAKLTFEVEQRISDPLLPSGAVAWQSPLAGAQVSAGTPIRVKLSSGLRGGDGGRSGGSQDVGLR